MKNWLKAGLIGMLVVFILYLIFNLIFQIGVIFSIFTLIALVIAFIIGFLISSLFSKNLVLIFSSIGGIIGFLIWLYDYDFLLNMAGPGTPISDSINEIFGIGSSSIFHLFFPLFVLIMSFYLLGLFIGFGIHLIKGEKK